MRWAHPWIMRNKEYIYGIIMLIKKKLDNQKLILKNWEGAAYRVKAFISYQNWKIRLNMSSFKQYHNFCVKKVHDWVQKIMYTTSGLIIQRKMHWSSESLKSVLGKMPSSLIF